MREALTYLRPRPAKAAQASIAALSAVPAIAAGDDLAKVTLAAMAASDLAFADGDVLVLAQKIVSKAEGRQIGLEGVTPSPHALSLAAETGKDPRLVELILSEAEAVVRVRPNLIIVRHRLGFVLANAGIDQSNVGRVEAEEKGAQVLLLPLDPDASAERLREAIRRETGARIAVLVIDSLGRAWRNGTVGTAIGVAGVTALLDLRGRVDLNGRALESSELGLADEMAAAASLLMGQADEGRPIVLLRGFAAFSGEGGASDLIRPREMDLFP